LAEFELLKSAKNFPPVLLLDVFFEKLDEIRIRNLLEFVCKENNGQVFITDTHAERLQQSLSQFGDEVQIIELV
jgi:DNA replication and repair protein RecF